MTIAPDACRPMRAPSRPVIAVVGSLNIDLVAYTARVPGRRRDRHRRSVPDGLRRQGREPGRDGGAPRRARRRWSARSATTSTPAMTLDNLAAPGRRCHARRAGRGVERRRADLGRARRDEPDHRRARRERRGRPRARPRPPSARSARVDVVIGQLEIPQRGHRRGLPGRARARRRDDPQSRARGDRSIAALIDASDWLIPNETEFAILAGIDRLEPGRRCGPIACLRDGAESPRLVADASESRGAALVSGGRRSSCAPGDPARRAVDTTGAGRRVRREPSPSGSRRASTSSRPFDSASPAPRTASPGTGRRARSPTGSTRPGSWRRFGPG